MLLAILVLLACTLLAPLYHQVTYLIVYLQYKAHHAVRAYNRHHNRHRMPPCLHLVRHAQGYHNLNVANHQIRDPLLTPYGKQECELLSKTFPYTDSIDLIVASPLKRTIYTALESFSDVIAKKNLTIVALPEMQETSDLPCDTGSDVEDLKKEFAGKAIDYSMVTSDWHSKKGRFAASAPEIEARCRVARNWLRNRPEKNIVVVSHGGLLHYFTEDWQGLDKFQG